MEEEDKARVESILRDINWPRYKSNKVIEEDLRFLETVNDERLLSSLLPALVMALEYSSYEASRQVIKILSKVKDPKLFDLLDQQLKYSEGLFAINNISEALANTGDSRAIDVFIKMLQGDKEYTTKVAMEIDEIKRCAINALVQIGEPTIPALIELIKEDRHMVAIDKAFIVLVRIGEPAIEALTELSKDEIDHLRAKAVEQLANMNIAKKSSRILRTIINSLEDKNDNVHFAAYKALTDLAERIDSIEILIELKKLIKEKIETMDRYASGYRKIRANLTFVLSQINKTKNRLLQLDIQLAPRIKPPRKQEGERFRTQRMCA